MLGKTLYDLRKRGESTLRNLLRPVGELLTVRVKLPKLPMTAVWIALCLLLFWMLCGCTPVKKGGSIPPLPPQADPRPMPRFTGNTFRDSILWGIEVREWGMSCEADKSVLRRVYGR